MKVYVLQWFDYDDSCILGIFRRKKDAQAALKKHEIERRGDGQLEIAGMEIE